MTTAISIPERRVIAVTGASSGIGREIARRGAKRGYAIVAIARRKERLDELAREIHTHGGACVTIISDVRAPGLGANIAAAALREFGRLDVLINNAGSGIAGTLLEQSDNEIEGQWQTHVAAPLRISREAFPALADTGGQIFFVGSGVARVPVPGYGAYCAVKAAVRAVAIQMRRELRTSGVAVTYVDPGVVATEFAAASGTISASPASIMVQPEGVADRILDGIKTRPRRVNAVPWQAATVALAEFFPAITDIALARAKAPQKMLDATMDALPERIDAPMPEAAGIAGDEFETALAPVLRRMERVKLSPDFVASLLEPGALLHLTEVAMRWAGMPNKNERAAMGEVLDALTAAGFLQKFGDETWRVVRPGR
ncbi:MAG: SDR family NAD(P)-dependent oxidoreductase [Candidatus Eremiobacteraeota bacterium]|nr:SDR family NAD(P)-dependent oxidoreductase [Candidatus Eremiobacteraeota bacterium]